MLSSRLRNNIRIIGGILFFACWISQDIAFAQLSGYEYRKKLTVDNTLVSGSTDLTDFPVLLSLTDADLATTGNSGFVTSSNGYDIAFTSSDGTTQLDHELESYNATTGTILAWVRFPTLGATADTDFYIYFGNSSQTTDQSTSSTWNSGYQLVMHLEDMTDATANANDGTDNGTTSTTGQFGNGRDFNSTQSDFISVADDPTLDITADLTMSAWVSVDNIVSIPDVMTKGDWDEAYASWIRGDATIRMADDGTTLATSAATVPASTATYITFTSSAGGSAVYINGAQSGTGGGANYSTNASDFTISSSGTYSFDGWMDEVRVSNVQHSADWIATEYANQNSPGTFYSETAEPAVLASVEASPTTAVAGGAAVPISSTLTVTAPFVDSLESATIQITGNYDSSEDVLAFTDTGLISGSWSSGSGTMTLTGRASLSDYQSALRSVTYQNTDGASPTQTTRTISFTVDDIFYTSNTVTRDLNVTQILSELSTDISNTVFHFDALDADGDANSGTNQPADGALTTWSDRSDDAGGSATDLSFTANAGAEEALLDAAYMGERSGLLFDGTDDYYERATDDALLNTGSYTQKSFAFVIRTGNSTSGFQIFYEQGGGTRSYQFSVYDGVLYAHAYNRGGGDAWGAPDGGHRSLNLGSVQPNETYIVIANHDNTTWEANVNGGSMVGVTNAGTMAAHSGNAAIGASDSGTRDPISFGNVAGNAAFFNGFIAEMISWNSALSGGQVASIYTFLCDKWCNEAPVLSGIEGTTLDFTEGDSPTVITSSISISDSDNTVLDSAKVTIASNFQSGEDELAFTDTGFITGSWDSGTGVLTLTGNTTLANYQTALRSITFENTNTVSPNTSLRTIDFMVYDWDDSSNIESRDINVISVNSTPSLSGIAGTSLTYNEGAGAVTPPWTATITDVDDTDMESATISITSNYFNGEDVLDFTDTGNITGSFNPTLGILTLSGTATLAEYETALESFTYENTSSDPIELTRTFSIVVNDGDNNSNTETRDLDIVAANSPPEFSNLESSNLAYPDDEVEITNTIEVYDPDDTTIDSALVIITGNFQSSEDSLRYTTLFGITGTYDETSGKLKLTGTSSFGDYETALRSVKYYNFAGIPSGTVREVSFLAYDDEGAESDTVRRTIEVNAVESISGLTVWLRADAGISTSGSEVTTWADQSGNGNDFVGVADAGTRPTYNASSADLGGMPSIEFAGNGDYFEDADGENYINGLTEFTLFLVYKSDLTNTDRGLWHAVQPDNDDKYFTIRYDASGANTGGAFTNVVKTGILANDADNQLESFSDIQTTSAQITSLHWDSGTLYDIYVDGILNNPSSAAAPPTGTIANADRAIVGKGGKDDPTTGNQSWDGQIAEVILYGRSLSESERESVEDYLSAKYNSAIRKITAATGGASISADDANTTYTSLTGPTIQEGLPGELTGSGTIILTAPAGYEWNTGVSPSLTITAAYGGSTNLAASFTSIDADEVTYTITTESTTTPGQIEFTGLEVRPTTGSLPNNGTITNTGTTGQGGGTNYGILSMVPGAADSLTFSQQPSITNVDSAITPSVRVQITDQFGNSVTTSGVNISIAKASGPGTLSGTSPASTNSLGISEFDDLSFDDVGTHELITTSAGLDSETSNTFDIVNAGVLTGFKIERFPSGNISSKSAGQTFDIVITAIDGTGTAVTTFNGTATISSSCSMGTGQGTTASFSSGVLSSHTVSITSVGSCTITATNTAGSENGVSNSFQVGPGLSDASTSTISASPTVILNDGASTSTITVQLKDAYGNNLVTGGKTVVLSETAGTLSSVTDNSDGTYTATLTSSTSITTSTITGVLGGDAMADDAEVEFAAFSHIWESQLGSVAAATDWFDTDNWNVGSVPGASSVVLIPASPAVGNEFPVVDVTNTTIESLTLESGSELSVTGSVNFIVTGNVAGEGDILGSNNDSLTVGGDLDVPDITLGTVIFDGSSDQDIISPLSFVNVEIDNSGTVYATDNLSVSGTLTMTNGELFIPSGKNLIANTQSYGSGELRFQRKINGSKGWRMLSSPVSSTYGDFLDGTVTQGYTGAFYSTGSNPGDTLQPNVLTYLEDYPGTDNQRYRAPTSSGQSLTEGQGIWVYFFGDIAADPLYNDPLPDTLDVQGQEFQGDGTEVDFGVTYTTTADSGWNFVGNPFGATIDWDDASNWTKTNIESTIYIWDPAANSGNGEYLTWNGVTGTLGSGLIAPFQGFWVKANATSPVLTVDEDVKTTGGSFIRKQAPEDTSPVIELEARANGLSKRTNIMFSNQSIKGRDRHDGVRLLPFSTSHIEFFSVLDDGTQLAINSQPKEFTNRIKIPLVLRAFDDGTAVAGEFMIRWNGMRGIPEEWLVTLIDNETGERIDLLEQQEYMINHSTKGKPQSNASPLAKNASMTATTFSGTARFTLQISTEEIEANIPEEFYLEQNYPNPFNPTTTIPFGLSEESLVKLEIFDILGRKVQTLINENRLAGRYNQIFNMNGMASGVYFYRLETNQGTFVNRLTLIK